MKIKREHEGASPTAITLDEARRLREEGWYEVDLDAVALVEPDGALVLFRTDDNVVDAYGPHKNSSLDRNPAYPITVKSIHFETAPAKGVE